MMIAATVGIILLMAMSLVFLRTDQARTAVVQAGRQIENGRYAIRTMGLEIRNAGWLSVFDPSNLALPTGKPDPCATTVSALNTALSLPIQGVYKVTAATSPSCLQDVKYNTDVLVIRHAVNCVPGSSGCDAIAANTPYFQAALCNPDASSPLANTELASAPSTLYVAGTSIGQYALDTNTANLTLHKNCPGSAVPALAPYYRYRTDIYYIANNLSAGDGIPTLMRAELGASTFSVVAVAEGIEDLRLQYGIDTSSSGVAGAFTSNPDTYNGCSGGSTAACVATNWSQVVAVKVNVLSRDTSKAQRWTDTKTYLLGYDDVAGQNIQDGPMNDQYRRHAFAATYEASNIAGRRGN